MSEREEFMRRWLKPHEYRLFLAAGATVANRMMAVLGATPMWWGALPFPLFDWLADRRLARDGVYADGLVALDHWKALAVSRADMPFPEEE